MCVIHISVQCSEKFSELMINDVQDTELTIESIVSTALLEVFNTVFVENVILHSSSENGDQNGDLE